MDFILYTCKNGEIMLQKIDRLHFAFSIYIIFCKKVLETKIFALFLGLSLNN